MSLFNWGKEDTEAVGNVSTTTDDNGNQILVGSKARLIDSRVK